MNSVLVGYEELLRPRFVLSALIIPHILLDFIQNDLFRYKNDLFYRLAYLTCLLAIAVKFQNYRENEILYLRSNSAWFWISIIIYEVVAQT